MSFLPTVLSDCAGGGNGAAPLPVTNKQSTLVFSSDRFIRPQGGLAGEGNGAAPLPVTNKQSTLVFSSDRFIRLQGGLA